MIFAISFSLCLVWASIASSIIVPRGLQEGVAEGGKAGNPGFKIRVTQAAADYIEALAQKALKDQFPRIRIKDVRANIHNGDVYLTNMKVTKFKPPEKHSVTLEAPDQVRWSTSDADISLHGDFNNHQQVLLSKVPTFGDFDADARGVDFTISFALSKSDDGGLSVKSRQCTASVRSLTANVHMRLTSLGAAVAGLYKNSVVEQMKPLVAAEMCQEARRFIDVELNKQLGTMSKKLPLNQTDYNLRKALRDDRPNRVTVDDDEDDGSASKEKVLSSASTPKNRTSGFRRLATNLGKNMVLDYSHIKDPIVTSRYVEAVNRGEISYEGQGGTPFYPTELREPTPLPTNRMLYLVASDFVLNSLFWHAYKHGLLTFRANKDRNPDQASLLRTSCDDDVFGICLGSIVPEVSKSYPNSDAELVFQAVKAPAVYFQRDGKVKLVAPCFVTAYAKKNGDLKEMLTSDVYVESQMRVWIDESNLKGNGTITKFDMTMRNNNLKDFTQEKLNDFAGVARGMFQDLANTELLKGIPLPTVQGASLVKPILRVFERTVRVETDITIDEDVLALLAIEALRNSNSKVSIDD